VIHTQTVTEVTILNLVSYDLWPLKCHGLNVSSFKHKALINNYVTFKGQLQALLGSWTITVGHRTCIHQIYLYYLPMWFMSYLSITVSRCHCLFVCLFSCASPFSRGSPLLGSSTPLLPPMFIPRCHVSPWQMGVRIETPANFPVLPQ
jgi:hypothetical protein